MNSRVVNQRYLIFLKYSHALNAQRIQVCPRQWEYVCNSGRVPFWSVNYENDRSSSCKNMNVVSIYCNHN